MIDWWVISSILAGLGTAYGANAYNKKDATELQKKAAELLASPEGKGWAAKIEELQSKVAATEADKQKAEEAAAKLQAAIDDLKNGIQTQKTALTGELQSLTSPDEVAWATVDPGAFASAIDGLMAMLTTRGVILPESAGRFAGQIRTAAPQARGTLQGFYAALKEAYEKKTGGRRGRGRKRKGGKAETALGAQMGRRKTPEETAADYAKTKAALTPQEKTSSALDALDFNAGPLNPDFLADSNSSDAPPVATPTESAIAAAPPEALATATEAPAVEVPPVAAPASEPPAAATPAVEVPSGATPTFPTQAEFSAEFLRLVSAARVAPPTMTPGMAPPPMMAPGMAPAVPLTKKDKEAQKAALALAEKLTRARDDAVKEIEPYKAHAETLAEDKKAAVATAYETLDNVLFHIRSFIPQLTQQEVREALWKEQKKVGEILNGKLVAALKTYKDAVGSLPSKFLSMFKKAKAEEPEPAVSTARHDAFVASTKDVLDRAEAAPKAIQTLRKSIKSELDGFFQPPEQFQGGCALVKRARDADVALAQSNFELKEAAPALKDLAAEFKTYTSEAKGSRIADSVFPPLESIPSLAETKVAAIRAATEKRQAAETAAPLLPPVAAFADKPLMLPSTEPPSPERAAEIERIREQANEEEKRQEVERRKAAILATVPQTRRFGPNAVPPPPPLPPPPPPEAPSQDGGLFGFSSKPGPVVNESPVLAGLYTSVITKSRALGPTLTAYEKAIQTGEGILKELQEMHSKEKAYLRLPPEQWAEERKSCGYLEDLPPAPVQATPDLAAFKAPETAKNGLKIRKSTVNVLPTAAPTGFAPATGLGSDATGIQLTSPAAPAAPAAPGLEPLQIEAPVTEPIPPIVGRLSKRLSREDSENISARLLTTTKGPTKASVYYELVSKWLAAWNKLTKPEKLAAKDEPAEAKALVLSAEGSTPPTQAGGVTDKERNDLLAGLDKAIAEVTEPTGGRSRKTTFKRRRGGKQNGRRSRRGKNRTDRTHSNSR